MPRFPPCSPTKLESDSSANPLLKDYPPDKLDYLTTPSGFLDRAHRRERSLQRRTGQSQFC